MPTSSATSLYPCKRVHIFFALRHSHSATRCKMTHSEIVGAENCVTGCVRGCEAVLAPRNDARARRARCAAGCVGHVQVIRLASRVQRQLHSMKGASGLRVSTASLQWKSGLLTRQRLAVNLFKHPSRCMYSTFHQAHKLRAWRFSAGPCSGRCGVCQCSLPGCLTRTFAVLQGGVQNDDLEGLSTQRSVSG